MRQRVGLIVAALGLLIPLAVLAFGLFPRPEARLDVISPSAAVVDRDGDVRLDLVVHDVGTSDVKVLIVSRAELSWDNATANLEPLRQVTHLEVGEAAAFPLMTVEPIGSLGETEQALLRLDLVWIGEAALGGDEEVKGSTWTFPVELRR